MAGRRPKPTVLHHLQGTFHAVKHRDRKFEPNAQGDLTTTPQGMTIEQRAAWRYVIKHAPANVLKKIDRDVLRFWVETLDRRNQAQQELQQLRTITPVLWSISPLHNIINRTTVLLIRLASELGFSPAARPRIKAEVTRSEAEDVDNPWNELRLVKGGRSDAE